MRLFETSPGNHNYAMPWDKFLIQCQYYNEFATYGADSKKSLQDLLHIAGDTVTAIFKVTPKINQNVQPNL